MLKEGDHSVDIYVRTCRDQMGRVQMRADADNYTHTQTNDLGMRPQEQSSLGTVSLTDHAQCMRMNSIDMGLD